MRVAIINSLKVLGGGEKWLLRHGARWKDAGTEPLVVCQRGAALQREAEAAGLPVAPVAMPHDVSVPAALAVAGALRRFRPDLVLCCNERAYRLGVPATRLAGGPPVVYRNGLTATFRNRSINRTLFRWTRKMVVNTPALREEMAAFGWIAPERLEVITNGIDLSLYVEDPAARSRVRRELETADDAVVLAVVARLAEDKGQAETLRAVRLLAGRFPALRLWLVGEGPRREAVEALARAEGVADRVRFTGYRGDVPAVLQGTDVVVQASHREGLGNTLLEAMASARPVVASTVGGNAEVVQPGETGELVPPRDPEALAAALAPVVESAELRARYGAAGRRRAAERFPLERETEAWLRLFAEVTG